MAAPGKRASEGFLGALHEAFAQQLLAKLQSGECTAADLNVIRAFLKDNGIECLPEHNDTMKGILDSLPSSDEMDDVSDCRFLS